MRTSTVSGFGSPSGEISPDSRNLNSLGWSSGTEFTDLVQEQSAVPGRADHAQVVAIGAGECPTTVAEQLALKHLARYRRTVERHEGPVGT